MVMTDSYVVGSEKGRVFDLLKEMIAPDDRFLLMRLFGEINDVSNDIFFLTHNGGNGLCRIWMSYPKHENAVSNWGAVFTPEEHRGNGYCAQTLRYCMDYIDHMPNAPLALFCTASIALTKVYKRYGFVTAIRGRDGGPLYRPLGNSPKTFQEFCEQYYTETDELHTVNATFAWRNEIDCLLRFALIDLGEAFGINGVNDIWPIILDKPERVKIILTREKRCVGWMLDGETQIHPKYRGIKIKNQ